MVRSAQKVVLVTGGAGFIGTHLCETLLKDENTRVICFDSFVTGRKENIAHLLSNLRFELVEGDITEQLSFAHIDQIYNLACPASPVHYQANPIRTIKTNTIGIMNVLGLAKKHGARVLQASTSEVYGDPLEHPQKETYWGNVNPNGIRACYDEGKRIGEALFFEYHRVHGVEIRVARIFNTYGPHMDKNDGRVVSNFIVQALEGKDITVYGDGMQTRSFCFVTDLVAGLIALMNGTSTGPINLGNPEELTMVGIAEKVLELTGSKSKLIHKPLPKDDPQRRKPDISLAKEKLNWEPKVSVAEGLAKTIEYFRTVT